MRANHVCQFVTADESGDACDDDKQRTVDIRYSQNERRADKPCQHPCAKIATYTFFVLSHPLRFLALDEVPDQFKDHVLLFIYHQIMITFV